MATVRELIKILADCDPLDDVFVNLIDDDGNSAFYSIDGLENSIYEYKRNPTFSICGGKLNVN